MRYSAAVLAVALIATGWAIYFVVRVATSFVGVALSSADQAAVALIAVLGAMTAVFVNVVDDKNSN